MVAIDLQFWFLFPVAIGIAVIAMATGVSGANFWVPVYLLWLHLDPQLGFWLSLVSMLIGFSSGVARNLRQGTINFFLLRTSLITALPATVLGAVTARFVHPRWLFLGFAVFVFLYSTRVLAVLLGSGGVAPPKKDRATLAPFHVRFGKPFQKGSRKHQSSDCKPAPCTPHS